MYAEAKPTRPKGEGQDGPSSIPPSPKIGREQQRKNNGLYYPYHSSHHKLERLGTPELPDFQRNFLRHVPALGGDDLDCDGVVCHGGSARPVVRRDRPRWQRVA